MNGMFLKAVLRVESRDGAVLLSITTSALTADSRQPGMAWHSVAQMRVIESTLTSLVLRNIGCLQCSGRTRFCRSVAGLVKVEH